MKMMNIENKAKGNKEKGDAGKKRVVRYRESLVSAARRYGVDEEAIERGLKEGDLFWAENPKNGVKMVCGEVERVMVGGVSGDVERIGLGGIVLRMVFGTVHGVAANVLWYVFWVTVVLMLAIHGNGNGAMVVGITVGMGKFIWAMQDEKKQRESGKIKTEEVGGGYWCDGGGGGGVFGWNVPCSAAKADLDWMLGKWGK